jgi:hypothetical protein
MVGRGTARPNELSLDPARDRAAQRLDAFFEQLDRMPTDRLDLLAVEPLDRAGHRRAVDRGLDAVSRLGRSELLARARETIEAAIPRRFGANALWVDGVISGPTVRASDLARLVSTLRDAALAVLAEDDLDEATFAELVGPCDRLVRGRPIA